MELSQGCPVDCGTYVWLKVFHCNRVVDVHKRRWASMHFCEVKMFSF